MFKISARHQIPTLLVRFGRWQHWIIDRGSYTLSIQRTSYWSSLSFQRCFESALFEGLLIWSVLEIESNRGFNAAVIFSILLNMKHLFIYSAPVFFAYLLKHDCVDSKNNKLLDFVKLGLVVLFVCGISLGPFIIYGQLQQVNFN